MTTRDVARRTKQLFDELEETGQRFLVFHHGRPVAMITPFDAATGAAVAVDREEPEDIEDLPELSPTERLALRALQSDQRWVTFMEAHQIPIGQALAAMTGLELAALAEPTFAGYRLTRRGQAVATRLAVVP